MRHKEHLQFFRPKLKVQHTGRLALQPAVIIQRKCFVAGVYHQLSGRLEVITRRVKAALYPGVWAAFDGNRLSVKNAPKRVNSPGMRGSPPAAFLKELTP